MNWSGTDMALNPLLHWSKRCSWTVHGNTFPWHVISRYSAAKMTVDTCISTFVHIHTILCPSLARWRGCKCRTMWARSIGLAKQECCNEAMSQLQLKQHSFIQRCAVGFIFQWATISRKQRQKNAPLAWVPTYQVYRVSTTCSFIFKFWQPWGSCS